MANIKHAILMAATSLLLIDSTTLLGQNSSPEGNVTMPRSGFDLGQFMSENVHYPESARLKNVEGKVIVKFIVNEDGHISDAVVAKSVSPALDSEAIRVVMLMPKWQPGEKDGKKVKVYFTLPLNFKLTDEQKNNTNPQK